MELAEIKSAAEGAMKAFEALKSEVLPLGKRFEELDADAKAKFDRMEKSVNGAIEAQQQFNGKVAAVEAQVKQLETALSRAPAGGGSSPEHQEKLARKKCKKLFNDFARIDTGNTSMYFDEFFKKAQESDAELKAMSVDSDVNGGYLTMPEFGGVIQTKVFETSPLRQLASVTSISSDTLEIIPDLDEAAASWVSERGSRTATNTPTLGKIDIYAHEMYANPQVTQKMLDDGIVDVEAWLAGKVADQFARTEATAFVTGNGVGKPKGIMSYDSGTTLTSQQVEQVVTGNASAITFDGFVNTQNALKETYQANATWLYRRATNAQVMLIKDGEGRPIFNMDFSKNTGLEPTLMGRPVRFASDVAAVSASALCAAYGDFKRAYQIVDRIGLRVLRDPYTNKPYVGFYTTRRVGGGAVNFEAYKIMKVST